VTTRKGRGVSFPAYTFFDLQNGIINVEGRAGTGTLFNIYIRPEIETHFTADQTKKFVWYTLDVSLLPDAKCAQYRMFNKSGARATN
jgi:hypothetical protein